MQVFFYEHSTDSVRTSVMRGAKKSLRLACDYFP